jgi:hypothetical protein
MAETRLIRRETMTLENDNIIAVNVPNFVSITIMAVIGALILGMIAKAYRKSQGQS